MGGKFIPWPRPRFGLCWPLRHVVMRPWWVRCGAGAGWVRMGGRLVGLGEGCG